MKNQNRSEQLVHEIGRKIVHGEVAPGEVLPKIEDLSETNGVSRTVVREAFKGLAARRLVRSNQRVGTIVLPRSDWQWWDIDVLTWASEKEATAGKFLLHLTEVRLGVEPSAAALAAKRATESDIAKITACYHELEQAVGDEKAWAKADYEFHKSILAASHNELMINIVKLLRKALVRSRETTISAMKHYPESPYGSPTEEVLERHRAIFEAIRDRDEILAHQKMSELILRVIRLLEPIYM